MEMRRPIHTILLAATLVSSGWGGTIRGRVIGAGDQGREPLVGATVLVQGTVRGTTTNARGEFRISELPEGTFTLIASMVGYLRQTKTDVVLEEGKETVVEFQLTPSPVQLEQVVVTAGRRPQSLEEVPVSISILDAAQIAERNSVTIDEALRYVSGVNMTGFQVNIRGSSGYSRGAGSRVLMLLDGIPFITGDTGELNFESIPVAQVDRIEVVKGASSALYGSNALGGVINIITKELPEIPETDVRMYAGAYNRPSHDRWAWTESPRWYNGQSVSHAFKSGDLGVGLYFSRHMDEGYRENDYRRRYNLYVKAREEFSPTKSLTVNFGLMDQYGGQFLYWRNLDSALRPPLLQDKDNVRSTRYYLTGSYNTVVSDGVLFTVKGMWYHNLWGFEAIHGIGRAESQADDFRLEALSTIVLNDVHTLTAGAAANMDVVSGDMFDAHTIGGAALYAQDDMRLSRQFGLTVGARFDYESVGLTTPGGQLNPKIALSYTPVDGTVLRASFGRGFRVPSVAEAFIQATVSNLTTVPNKDLRPERSLSYEIGLSQRLWGIGTLDIAGFRSDYDDLIEAGLIVSGQDVQIQWQNVTEARVTGFETGLNLGFFGGDLQYSIGYTYVYPEDLTQGTILKYRPRHVFATNLLGRLGPLFAGADFRFISRVEEIDDELVQVGIIPDGDERVQILVTDVRLGADFHLGGVSLNATLLVNNLFQYNYVELIGNLMPPRSYALVVSIKP